MRMDKMMDLYKNSIKSIKEYKNPRMSQYVNFSKKIKIGVSL